MENSAVKINELESTIKGYKEIVESSANTASTKADIALDKADIATEKAGIATEKATEVSTALSTKANKDMDNLSNTWKENVAHLAMPSSSYVDLSFISNSVSSSGYTYIAPGTGYFSFNFVTAGSGSGSSVVLYRNDKPVDAHSSLGHNAGLNCQCKKGDILKVTITSGNLSTIRNQTFFTLKEKFNAVL